MIIWNPEPPLRKGLGVSGFPFSAQNRYAILTKNSALYVENRHNNIPLMQQQERLFLILVQKSEHVIPEQSTTSAWKQPRSLIRQPLLCFIWVLLFPVESVIVFVKEVFPPEHRLQRKGPKTHYATGEYFFLLYRQYYTSFQVFKDNWRAKSSLLVKYSISFPTLSGCDESNPQ